MGFLAVTSNDSIGSVYMHCWSGERLQLESTMIVWLLNSPPLTLRLYEQFSVYCLAGLEPLAVMTETFFNQRLSGLLHLSEGIQFRLNSPQDKI